MIVLFISAFVPLFLIMAIKAFNCNFETIMFIYILGIISWADIVILSFMLKRLASLDYFKNKVTIKETKNNDYIVFIMTYLVPFFGITLDFNTLLAFIVLFTIIGYIYINTSLFTINPTLMLFWKYNLYQGVINENNVFIITKNQLKNGLHELKLIKLSNDVYMGV